MNKRVQGFAINGSVLAGATTPIVSNPIPTDMVNLVSMQLIVAAGVVGTWLVEVSDSYADGQNGMPTTTAQWSDISKLGNQIPQPDGTNNLNTSIQLGNPFFCWAAVRVTFTPVAATGAGAVQSIIFGGAI